MALLREQAKREFKPTNVGITEFAESSEYCGKPLFPLQRILLKLIFLEEMEGWEEDLLTWMINGGRKNEILLSPEIRERRDYCREHGFAHFSEIDLVGGRRSSKGHITGLAGAYKLWRTREIPDPATFFGIDIDKQIEFSCIAAAFDQAKTRQFADFYSSINRCKALQPYISKRQEEVITIRSDSDILLISDMKKQGVKIARDFAKFRVLPLAANADTLRGSASILTVFDEMAFMMPGESRSSASECYTAAEPSLAQFGHHAMVFCNSSPYTRIGQFYEQWSLAMRPLDHADGAYPMRFAIQFPSWALYDKWWVDPERRFDRAIMVSPDWDDQLEPDEPESKLNEQSISMRNAEQLKEKANPDTYKVEYRAQWAEVLDAYLDPAKVDRAYNGLKPDGTFCRRTEGGTYLYVYMGHCDPSSTTAGFGFALGHVEEFADASGLFPGGVARHVVFDEVKRWNPRDFPGEVINYIKVREELAHYINLYRPLAITFDQYNCLNGDSMVPTTQGLLTMRELANPGGDLPPGGIRALNIPIQSQSQVATLQEAFHRGIVPTLRLRTKLGNVIEATPEHRLWVRPQKTQAWHKENSWQWMKVKDIRDGDWVSVRKNNVLSETYVDLSPFHVIGKRKRPSRARYDSLPSVCDESFSALLGYLTSDGWVSDSAWNFSNCNREVVEDFESLLTSSFGGIWNASWVPYTDKWSSHAVIRSEGVMAQFFTSIGVGGLSHEKVVPAVIRKSPKSVITSYLSALFEGDGGITVARDNYEEVQLTTTSESLAREVQQLLLAVGVFSTLWGPHDKRDGYRVKIFGLDLLDFEQEVGFRSSDKKARLRIATDRVRARGDRAGRRSKNNRRGNEQFVKIVSIETSESDCYDFSVPGPESFIANGVVSHNSAGLMQELRDDIRKMGIANCRIAEVTATQKVNWNRWEAFKTALYLGLVHVPPDCITMGPHGEFDHSEYSKQELKFLQEVQAGQTKRVDKQVLGPIQTKDIADCIAEVTVKFLGSYIGEIMNTTFESGKLQTGSEGGYPIGGRHQGGPMSGMNQPGNRFDSFYGGRRSKAPSNAARGIDPRRRRGR